MNSRRRNLLRLLAVLLSFVLIAAACGDDADDTTADDTGTDDTDDSDTDDMDDADDSDDMDDTDTDDTDTDDTDDTSTDDLPELTDSFTGVTSTTITVGIAMLNFEELVSIGASSEGWGDQQAVWQTLIDDLNANGGVLGREIVPVYEFYSPISPEDATRACTVMTEDNEVFAVLGGFVGPVVATNTCVTQLNSTILVGGNQSPDALAASNAPYYQPGSPDFALSTILLNLLDETGRLEGAKVFVMGGNADAANHDPVIELLSDRGVEVVGDNMYLANDIEDTAAQDDELGIITEQIKQSGATAVFIHGTPSASIRGLAAAGLNETLDIWTNNPGGLNNLGETITDKSIADGVITSGGADDTSIFDDPLYQSQCHDVVAASDIGADLRTPQAYEKGEENWFNSVRRYCQHLDLFVQIATNAGGDLTQETFQGAAEAMNDFVLPGMPAASLSAEKPYANDLYALQEYDSTAGDGVAVPLGEFIDAFT